MLQTKSVSPGLLAVLDKLMQLPELDGFRLVGGTALALQLGHRISVDIDLFTDRSFDTYQVLQAISGKINIDQVTRTQIGLTFFAGDIKVNLCNWAVPFLGNPVSIGNIRISPLEDIGAFKLDAITARKDKKDYYDLYFLFNKNSLDFYLRYYKIKYPYNNLKNVISALVDTGESDNSPLPNLLVPLDWEQVKETILRLVAQWLQEQENKSKEEIAEREATIQNLIKQKKKE